MYGIYVCVHVYIHEYKYICLWPYTYGQRSLSNIFLYQSPHFFVSQGVSVNLKLCHVGLASPQNSCLHPPSLTEATDACCYGQL